MALKNCFRTYHLHARYTLHHKGCYPSHRLLLEPKISVEGLLAYPVLDLMQGKSESLWWPKPYVIITLSSWLNDVKDGSKMGEDDGYMGKIDIEGGQLKSTNSVRHQLMLDARHLPDNPWNTEVTPTVSVTTFLHDAAVERPTTTNGGKKNTKLPMRLVADFVWGGASNRTTAVGRVVGVERSEDFGVASEKTWVDVWKPRAWKPRWCVNGWSTSFLGGSCTAIHIPFTQSVLVFPLLSGRESFHRGSGMKLPHPL